MRREDESRQEGGGPSRGPGHELAETVERKAARKERAARERRHGVWFGLGMFGLIGWAVAVPTLAGVALGLWLDAEVGGDVSWTLAGLGAGICLGCLNAWWWVRRHAPEDRRHADRGGPGA